MGVRAAHARVHRNVSQVTTVKEVFDQRIENVMPCTRRSIFVSWQAQWSSTPVGWSSYSSWGTMTVTEASLRKSVDTWLFHQAVANFQLGSNYCSISQWGE